MEKSKNKWVNILRWLCVIPVVIISYIIFKIVYKYFANYIVSEIFWQMFNYTSISDNNTFNYINEINNSQGFAGHYVIGTVYIFTKELFGVAIATFSGIYIAPSHKRQVGFSLIILIIISSFIALVFMIKTRDQFIYSTETIFRIILEYLGMLVGAYFSWKISRETRENYFPK